MGDQMCDRVSELPSAVSLLLVPCADKIPTAVRNARHSIAGVSTINGGLVLDVSLMKGALLAIPLS